MRRILRIVIVGGGFAGAYAAHQLEKKFDVTLIDSKNYFEFTPSVLKTLVEPSHIKKIQVLHSHYLHKANIIKGDVEEIQDGNVIMDSGQVINYNYLIISSGSRYSSPIKEKNLVIATRGSKLREYAKKLKTAQNILIIGGGIVGVELAAEIIEHYPEKNITMVHSRGELSNRSPKKARNYTKKYLEEKGVKIIFNEKVIGNEGHYKTNKDRKLHADIAFMCVGIIPNYEYLKKHCSTSLNEKNNLCVNSYLQVEGHKNIFAAGDITAINEEKTAQSAEKQAAVVSENIINLEENKLLTK
jgi:apoptosis-inducing factor 2